jgi:hypothetical protein
MDNARAGSIARTEIAPSPRHMRRVRQASFHLHPGIVPAGRLDAQIKHDRDALHRLLLHRAS